MHQPSTKSFKVLIPDLGNFFYHLLNEVKTGLQFPRFWRVVGEQPLFSYQTAAVTGGKIKGKFFYADFV